MMIEFAKEFELIPSGGSDYHGTNQPKINLATGYGEMRIPEGIYLDLKRYHEERWQKS